MLTTWKEADILMSQTPPSESLEEVREFILGTDEGLHAEIIVSQELLSVWCLLEVGTFW
jgi:hypothetical protein